MSVLSSQSSTGLPPSFSLAAAAVPCYSEDMDSVKTVAQLCQEHALDPRQLADRSGLDESRVLAILQGRWTPSPTERDHIAAVFGLTRDGIAWGHTTPVEHLYGHGPQF